MKRPTIFIEFWCQIGKTKICIHFPPGTLRDDLQTTFKELKVSNASLRRLRNLTEDITPSYVFARVDVLAVEYRASDIREHLEQL